MPEIRVFSPAEWPDVEVLVDGVWCEGELRSWTPSDGGWVGQVQWRRGAGLGNYLSSFPAEQIRKVDPS